MQHHSIKLIALLCLALAFNARSATYYVNATGGNDSRTTTEAQNPATPWLTITKAEDNMVAGDRVNVANGTYDERVTITTSGTPANPITYYGNATGTGVVMRGFTVSGADNWRVMGFEITHVNTTFARGFLLSGLCTNWLIEGNYIHDVNQEGINTSFGGPGSDPQRGIIRDNYIYWIAHPGSLQSGNTAIAGGLGTDHVLIEYNHVERSVDFVDFYGTNHVKRNNWMHHFRDEYWSVVGHPDFFQPGSDGAQTLTRHHVYEANRCGDAPSDQAHWALWQDNLGGGLKFGDTNMLMRNNVGYDIGNAGTGVIATDKVQQYNNTFEDMLDESNGNIWNWYRSIAQNGGSVGGLLINSVISDDGISTDAINIEAPDNLVTASHNWGYLAGSETSYIGTTDPLFVNISTHDYRLQSGSPLRGVGTHITTITNANGSGTSFGVPDSHRFFDGWGIVEGDIISFPGGATARITYIDITNNIWTVASSITWTNNQRVYYGPRGYQADIGAYPFGVTFLSAATYSVAGGTATISTTGDARKVRKYRDGIPVAEDYDAPFTFADHQAGDTYKAYAFYAQEWPVVNASEGVSSPGPTVSTIAGAGKLSPATQGF